MNEIAVKSIIDLSLYIFLAIFNSISNHLTKMRKGEKIMAKVTWLHLSDLHFGRNDESRYNQNIIINDLIDDIIKQIRVQNLNINLVFATGDVTFSGKSEDLETAKRFFDKLSDAIAIDPSNILFVPGNHDIIRSQELEEGLESFKAQNNPNYVSPASISPAFTKALANYTSFVNQIQRNELYHPNDLFYETKRMISGKTVSILGLNTAWSSVKDLKPGDIILGEYQVRKTLQAAKGSDLIIALMHHPFFWLSEEDNQQSKGLLSRRSDFVLSGHVHVVSDIGQRSIFGNAFCITAGALYDHSKTYSNSYNITTCDLESGTGTIYFRQYVESQGGFWTADNTIDSSIPDGVVTFQLPLRIQIDNTDKQKNFSPSLPLQAAEKREVANIPAPHIPNALIDDIRDGKCYLFAGAGASMDAGLPSWFELLSNGIDELQNRITVSASDLQELRELLSNGHFLIVADYLRFQLGEIWFGDYIRRYLSTKGRRSAMQETLSAIPFRVILTTNYDDYIEKHRIDSKILLPKQLMTELSFPRFSFFRKFICD